jgi:hypothetical protein
MTADSDSVLCPAQSYEPACGQDLHLNVALIDRLTSWSPVLLERRTIRQLDEQLPTFYGNWDSLQQTDSSEPHESTPDYPIL